MTDRELLELAARAAGLASIDFLAGDGFANVYDADGRHSAWNPLDDDGDALRLLVKLRLDISSEHDQVSVIEQREILACELYGSDANAATRRAITRAAAEIGRKMQ